MVIILQDLECPGRPGSIKGFGWLANAALSGHELVQRPVTKLPRVPSSATSASRSRRALLTQLSMSQCCVHLSAFSLAERIGSASDNDLRPTSLKSSQVKHCCGSAVCVVELQMEEPARWS